MDMKGKISIGIDIGGTNIEVAWVDKEGNYLKHFNYKTKNFLMIEDLVESLGDLIREENIEFADYGIRGIGIGAPNGNYYTGSIDFAPNLPWDGFIPLATMMQAKTGLPVKLTNDANAAAYAEMKFGGAKGMKNFVLVTLGTGLGAGIVVNGEILYGSTGFAGELGHTTAIEGGRLCGCGKKGCLETYVSATGIVRTMTEVLASSEEDSILRSIRNPDSKDIFEAASAGDKLSLEIFRYTGKILGKQLADYVAVFSPEAIFLTGGLAKAHRLLLPPTRLAMEENMLTVFKNTAHLRVSELIEKNAGLLGAAGLQY
jgi:glucokinase